MTIHRPHDILRGFTLLEIIVVLAIIGILATVGTLNFSETSATARDAQRQTDLKNLQNAIETYRSQNGRYPYQATSTGSGNNGWSGQLRTNYRANDTTGQYIVGLAPEYIPVLPTDPRLNGEDSGYVYRTNAEGTVYKLMAFKTVESESVSRAHPLKPCDIRVEQNPPPNGSPTVVTSRNPNSIGWCAAIHGVSFTYPQTICNENTDLFRSSYAVWGGISLDATVPFQSGTDGIYAADPVSVVGGINLSARNLNMFKLIKPTTDVICK